jgi:hypothetical protein
MELFLNSVWVLVVAAGVYSWLQHGRPAFAERRMSIVALAMLLVILFPVISVSDDLWSMHNPAETDTCQRRDHRVAGQDSDHPMAAALPVPVFAGLSLSERRVLVPQRIAIAAVSNPAFDSIQNRPPPVA